MGAELSGKDFFSLTGQSMGEKIVLITVEHHGELVAGALNLRDHKLFMEGIGVV